MEDFIPKVITHTMSKHGYRDVTICQTREEYIKKINDIFDEHDNNCNTFSQLDKKYEPGEVEKRWGSYFEKTAKVGNGLIDIQMHTGSGKAKITK